MMVVSRDQYGMLRDPNGNPLCEYCGQIPSVDLTEDTYNLYQDMHAPGVSTKDGRYFTAWVCDKCGGRPHDDDNCQLCIELRSDHVDTSH